MCRSGLTTRHDCRTSASGTAESTRVLATPISTRRPGTNSPACSASPTLSPINRRNESTEYQEGVDMHFDGGASQLLTKQVQVGVVGYVYRQLGCDPGAGDRVGCFHSQVVGAGPQVGFIIPLSTTTQGYLNLKS